MAGVALPLGLLFYISRSLRWSNGGCEEQVEIQGDPIQTPCCWQRDSTHHMLGTSLGRLGRC